MSAPSCNARAQPSRSAKRTLTFPIAALVALAACSPVAAPSATNGAGPSMSSDTGSSPSTVRRSPEATRYDGPLILFTRVRSDNPQVKLRGIALWLTVAYYETKDSKYGEVQNLHRQLMRTLRILKESAPVESAQWIASQAGQAA